MTSTFPGEPNGSNKSSIPNIHRGNLGNRERLENALVAAKNGNFIGWAEMGTMAETLCHTLSSQQDILHTKLPKRIFQLIQEGLIEIVPKRSLMSEFALKASDRFVITAEGAKRLESAVQKEYAPITQVMVEYGRAAGEDDRSEMAEEFLNNLDQQNQEKIGQPNSFYVAELDRLLNKSEDTATE